MSPTANTDTDQTGNDFFTYRLTDSGGNTATADA